MRQLRANPDNDFWISIINVGEVFYRIARTEDRISARLVISRLEQAGVTVVNADRVLTLAAADLKATYPLAYADCFAAALARQLDARIVTGDREFRPLEEAGVVGVEWLPRARARR